jgi:hypothetical protein
VLPEKLYGFWDSHDDTSLWLCFAGVSMISSYNEIKSAGGDEILVTVSLNASLKLRTFL